MECPTATELGELRRFWTPEENAEIDWLLAADPVPSTEAPPFPDWLAERFPDWRWDWPHLALIQAHLERVTSGECRRLMLFLPPRHGKSEQTTIRYPVWRLERKPSTRVCVGCYNQRFAERFGRRSRRIAEAHGAVSSARRASVEWETNAGGVYRSCGVGSPPTGEGFDLIVIDDPVKSREEAESEAYRERAWEWYGDLYTRREPGASIILIQTRWHADDLAGRLLEAQKSGGDMWEVVSLPALAEAGDPLNRAEGEALCPDRFTAEDLAQTKATLGSYAFQAEYQQSPTAPGGNLLHAGLILHREERPANLRFYQAWDLAISTKSTADYTCCATVAVDVHQNLYLADVTRGRWGFNETLSRMKQMADIWQPVGIGIETTAYQAAAFEEATSRHFLPFTELKADKDKVVRAQLLAARIEAGKVIANRNALWWADFEAEALAFPAGRHDDQVDAVVYAAMMAASPPSAGTVPVAPDMSMFEDRRVSIW